MFKIIVIYYRILILRYVWKTRKVVLDVITVLSDGQFKLNNCLNKS